MVGAALVAVGLGVGVFMLVSARGGSSSKTAAAPPQETTSATTATASPATAPATAAPTPPPVAPVPPPVAEQPEPAPQQAPAMVTVVVESKPVGAEVFAVADGAILGITPLTLRRPQGTSPIAIVVKAKRRKPANSEVSFAKDDTVRVDLDKIGTRPVRDPKPTGSTTTPTNQPSTLPDGTVDPFSRMKTRDKQ